MRGAQGIADTNSATTFSGWIEGHAGRAREVCAESVDAGDRGSVTFVGWNSRQQHLREWSLSTAASTCQVGWSMCASRLLHHKYWSTKPASLSDALRITKAAELQLFQMVAFAHAVQSFLS